MIHLGAPNIGPYLAASVSTVGLNRYVLLGLNRSSAAAGAGGI